MGNMGSHEGYQGYFYSPQENENEITLQKFGRKSIESARAFRGFEDLFPL